METSRNRPVSGHIYGREFVPPYAAAGVTDTHEAIDRDIANDFIDAGIWVFLRGGNPATPWNSIVESSPRLHDTEGWIEIRLATGNRMAVTLFDS